MPLERHGTHCGSRSDHAALGLLETFRWRNCLSFCQGLVGEDFRINRALNLDGGSSSAFWFKRSNGSVFSISEMKNVRDLWA
jgi:hypothetical protein